MIGVKKLKLGRSIIRKRIMWSFKNESDPELLSQKFNMIYDEH